MALLAYPFVRHGVAEEEWGPQLYHWPWGCNGGAAREGLRLSNKIKDMQNLCQWQEQKT